MRTPPPAGAQQQFASPSAPPSAQARWAGAFGPPLPQEAAAPRRRAEERIRRWRSVLDGIATGRLTVGSRAPVAGLPAWVTPEVVRGGFATGTPAAGGPLRPYEAAVAGERGVVFAHYLTDAGQAELCSLLDSGGSRVGVPGAGAGVPA